MIRGRHIAALAVCSIASGLWLGATRARPQAASQGPIIAGNPAPSAEQIHSLLVRVVESQHRDDRALDEFERTEHVVAHKPGNTDIISDISERHVPSPAGDIKLKLTENGTPVSPELYRQELEFAANALGQASHPDDRYKEGVAKYDKRHHDHAELIDEAAKAFRITWAGRETLPASIPGQGPRTLTKFLLDPDPDYKPINRLATTFQHIHAAVWVDEAQAQIAHVEGDIATDITFVGGVVAKVYHGGYIVMDQDEVAPGIWLPTMYNYEVDGRKFLFAFGVHERTEITRYRRIGPPPQAVEIMRNELSNLAAATPAQ